MSNLGVAYKTAGRPDRALPLFEEAAAGVEKRGFRHEHACQFVCNLVCCYEDREKLDRAEAWRRARNWFDLHLR